MNEVIHSPSFETMSSREIAELAGKEHKHVTRDIRLMLIELKLDETSFGRIYRDSMNREQTEYFLNLELTDTLLTGYSVVARNKVIKRWHVLEQDRSHPIFAIPRTFTEALRLAADLAEGKAKAELEVVQQQKLLEVVKPKAAALDLISTFAEGSMCLTNAAKALQVQPKRFFAWLQEHAWIYRRAGGSGFVGYQGRIQVGYLGHKVTTIERSDGTTKQVEQVLVTAKGLAKLAMLFGGPGFTLA